MDENILDLSLHWKLKFVGFNRRTVGPTPLFVPLMAQNDLHDVNCVYSERLKDCSADFFLLYCQKLIILKIKPLH